MKEHSKQCLWTVVGLVRVNNKPLSYYPGADGRVFTMINFDSIDKEGILTLEKNNSEFYYTHLDEDPNHMWTLYEFESELERLTIRSIFCN